MLEYPFDPVAVHEPVPPRQHYKTKGSHKKGDYSAREPPQTQRQVNPRFSVKSARARRPFRAMSPVVQNGPISPNDALSRYSLFLTPFEMDEIQSFPEIYYVGQANRKIIPNDDDPFNYGFDNDFTVNLIPSLKEFSIIELMRLWSQYRVQSMKALFKTLAIDIEPYKQYLGKYDLVPEENIIDPWFDLRVQNLCADKEFTDKIQVELDRKRSELLEYFENKKGITNNEEPMFMVDIGWRGTIQDNLAHIFTNKKIGGYYLTLYDYYNLQPKNTYKLSYIDDKNIRNNEVACMITLLEWIYNPGTGSVVEYKQGEAIRKAKSEETDIVKEYIKPLQDGMFEAAKIINEYMKYHPYEAFETKGYVYDLIRKTKTNPSKELVEAYYSMVFNDTFGTATYVEKDDKLSTMQKLNIFKCRDLLRKEMWKEAFIIHNDIEYMNALTGAKSLARKMLGKE